MVNNRRSSIQIIAEILKLGEAKKTEIMYSVNMSYAQVCHYLDFLTSKGILERIRKGNNGITLYRTTPKGEELLREIEKLNELLS